MEITKTKQNGYAVLTMKNDQLELEIAPEVGGRILAIRDLKTGYQFLWKNEALELERLPAGSEYDPHFYGGMDELLPNDMPEEINGVLSPDHGELWTLALSYQILPDRVVMEGVLPLCGLKYRKKVSFTEHGIALQYCIANPTDEQKAFLWKFHAAMKLEPGDEIVCPANTAMVADPQWTKWKQSEPFSWPLVDGQRADVIPPKGEDVDFLYLYDLKDGVMGWKCPSKNLAFMYRFDTKVFPYCWYFASYGGFFGHYTGILEPCTTMPCSVNEARAKNQCSVLTPGAALETEVFIYAGEADKIQSYMREG